MRWAWLLLSAALTLLIAGGSAGAETSPYKTIYYNHSNTACADKPGTNHMTAYSETGIAFNGTDLMFSCWGDNTITLINAHTHGQDGIYRIVDGSSGKPLGGIGALAWDAADNVLWACNLSAYPLKTKNKAKDVGSITLDPSTMTGAFTHVLNAAGGCDNGVGYDAHNPVAPLWTASVSTTIYNYTTGGALMGQQGITGLWPGWAGGFAFTANHMYISDPQTHLTKSIYELPRDFSSATNILSGSKRYQDMECDATTFAPQTVIWVEWFNQNAAMPIPVSGTC